MFFFYAGPALECKRGEDSRAPTIAAGKAGQGRCMPVVCNEGSVVAQFIKVVDAL